MYRLAKELMKRGDAVNIVTSAPWEKSGGKECHIEKYVYEELSVTAISLNPNVISEGDKYSELSPVLIQSLSTIFKDLSPDIVHINGLKSASIVTCNGLNIPHVVSAHHAGFACPAGDLLTPSERLCDKVATPDVCIPCCSKRKCASNVQGLLLGHIPEWAYRPIGSFFNRRKDVPYVGRGLMYPYLIAERLKGQTVRLTKADSIISPSEAMKELMLRNGVPPEKVILLPHGILPLNILPIEQIENSRIRFGYIGRVDRAKGFHILVEALELISSQDRCELHIFGGAQSQWDREYMKECLRSYRGKSKILEHGHIPNDQLSSAFEQVDVLVLPSICIEVFGLAILEAFSSGRPVIVSKSGGPTELVRHGIDGFVVERNDSEALAEAMQKFIDDPGIIHSMAKQLPHVKTMSEYVDEIKEVYSLVIDNHTKSKAQWRAIRTSDVDTFK